MQPRIRACHQVFSIDGESSIYIGRGIEKVEITNPERGFMEFLKDLISDVPVANILEKDERRKGWLETLNSLNVLEYRNDDLELLMESHPFHRYSRQIFHFVSMGTT